MREAVRATRGAGVGAAAPAPGSEVPAVEEG
jgi:hypothetical protein